MAVVDQDADVSGRSVRAHLVFIPGRSMLATESKETRMKNRVRAMAVDLG
jgi:hypothetical protein